LPTLSIVIEFVVVTILTALADRLFSTKAALIVLCVCLPLLGYIHRSEIMNIFHPKTPSAKNSPPASLPDSRTASPLSKPANTSKPAPRPVITNSKRLELEQQDVYQHLELSVRPALDPTQTAFTITNGSLIDLGAYQIECKINLEIFEGYAEVADSISRIAASADGLKGGGDADTSLCLRNFQAVHSPADRTPRKMECADITVLVKYALPNQPATQTQKPYRGIIRRSDDNYVWDQKPINSPGTLCTL
jgi:hypothetical protein